MESYIFLFKIERIIEMIVSVLIASHLNVQKRVDTIQRAVKSVFDQTRKPERLCISFSYEKDVDIVKLSSLKEMVENKGIEFVLLAQHERKLQFEHFEILLKHLEPILTEKDWFCFLDDDDTFHKDRISSVVEYEKELVHDTVGFCNYGLVYLHLGHTESTCILGKVDEYVRYFVYWKHLYDFYRNEESIKTMQASKVGESGKDIFFAIFMRDRLHPIKIDKILYYQYKDFTIPRCYVLPDMVKHLYPPYNKQITQTKCVIC